MKCFRHACFGPTAHLLTSKPKTSGNLTIWMPRPFRSRKRSLPVLPPSPTLPWSLALCQRPTPAPNKMIRAQVRSEESKHTTVFQRGGCLLSRLLLSCVCVRVAFFRDSCAGIQQWLSYKCSLRGGQHAITTSECDNFPRKPKRTGPCCRSQTKKRRPGVLAKRELVSSHNRVRGPDYGGGRRTLAATATDKTHR